MNQNKNGRVDMLPKYSSTGTTSVRTRTHSDTDGSLTGFPADVAYFHLLGHDELSCRGRRSIDVFFLLSINLLIGLLQLLNLVLDVLQQLGVVCEGVLESALAEDTPIGADVDYEVSDRADHRDVVSLKITGQASCYKKRL